MSLFLKNQSRSHLNKLLKTAPLQLKTALSAYVQLKISSLFIVSFSFFQSFIELLLFMLSSFIKGKALCANSSLHPAFYIIIGIHFYKKAYKERLQQP